MANVRRLPGPIADVWEWQAQGLCRGRDSAQFFHPDGERGSSRSRREYQAKQLCGRCPVRSQCAAHALATHEPYGVWGGFTEAERLRLLALGWEDAADRYRHRVDVDRLAARLEPGRASTRAARIPARRTASPAAGTLPGPRAAGGNAPALASAAGRGVPGPRGITGQPGTAGRRVPGTAPAPVSPPRP